MSVPMITADEWPSLSASLLIYGVCPNTAVYFMAFYYELMNSEAGMRRVATFKSSWAYRALWVSSLLSLLAWVYLCRGRWSWWPTVMQ